MIESFIISKLSEIGRAIEKGNLLYVKVTSSIDESFGRTYIRWSVEVERNGMENHYYSDYKSYQLWGKEHGFFKEPEYARRHFDSTMIQYYSDIQRFIELVTVHYPDIKLYNDVCDFELMNHQLFISGNREITVIIKNNDFNGDQVFGQHIKINDRFSIKTLKHFTEIEIEDSENHWALIQHKEWRNTEQVQFNDYPKRMEKHYNKHSDKFNFRSDYIHH